MIIPIDEKWRIKSDKYCWHIQSYKGIPTSGKMKGQEHWHSERFYQTLGGAVFGLAELELMTGDTRTLEEALDAVQQLSARLSMALTPHIEIKE